MGMRGRDDIRILWFLAFVVLVPATRAWAAPESLLSRARRDGTVRVLARLRVADQALARLPGSGRDPERRTAIRRSQARVEAALGETAWQVTRSFDVVPFVALELAPDALERLSDSGEVDEIEEDRLEKILVQENIEVVQADQTTAAGLDGGGWTVAVLDTGIDSGHPYLSGSVVSEACFSANGSCPNGSTTQTGAGAGAPCSYASNSCKHGTHVGGIVAGHGNSELSGVAPGANLIAIQVFSRFSGNVCDDDIEDPCAKTYTSDTIAALERVYELRDSFKIAAVNMSLGGGSFLSEAGCDIQDSARKAIVDQLRSVGIVTVAASGNESRTNALSAPGCLSTVVSVGATTNSDQVAGFSNSASFLDVLAPGVQIVSSVPGGGFASISGTSQATPHVSAAFAVLNQRLGHADIDVAAGALENTGQPVLDSRNGLTKPRIRILDAVDSLPNPGLPSGVQITPDGKRTLISKDVGQERWAITANADDGSVTGNVFKADGGEPSFVWCERLGDDGNPDPYAVQITFACSGADACESQSCPLGEWVFLRNVTIPGSFLLPPQAGSASHGVGSAAGATVGDSPSGLQITPDSKHTLINKDVNGERWAITQNPDDWTVTGNVFRPTGGDPVFLWCERIGDNGDPDPSSVLITFRCQAADRCEAAPCSSSDWSVIAEPTLPGSFFLP